MVTAKQLFDANQLGAAIVELNTDVKAHPTDPRLRTFLFELLCFAGDFDRAQRQLDALVQQQPSAGVAMGLYASVLRAAAQRRDCFTKGYTPQFLLAPPPYVQFHLDALARLREGRTAEAVEMLERAEALYPPLNGRLQDRLFSTLQDADDRLAPIMELFVAGAYTWVPFEHCQRIVVSPPTQLRDLIWAPVRLELITARTYEGFAPVLYPDTERHADDVIRLGRRTEWVALDEAIICGVGQRLFLMDDRDLPVLELHDLMFERVGHA